LSFAHVYNTSAQTVDLEADCTFDHNGIISAGITHTVGTAQVNIGNSGIYSVLFSVMGHFTNQFTLAVNGTPVAANIFGIDDGAFEGQVLIPNTGFAILALTAGDVLTLRNHSSLEPVVHLTTQVGGTQSNINASILITQLS